MYQVIINREGNRQSSSLLSVSPHLCRNFTIKFIFIIESFNNTILPHCFISAQTIAMYEYKTVQKQYKNNGDYGYIND